MLPAEQVEELIGLLASWDHPTLVTRFRQFRSNFPIDCSDEFLFSLDADRLRHIFLALCLQNKRLPETVAPSLPNAA